MIVIDQLRISDDGENLILDAHVNAARYFDNVYIEEVRIDTQDTFLESGPSSNPIYSKVMDDINTLVPNTEKPIVITEKNLIERIDVAKKALVIEFDSPESTQENFITFALRFQGNGLTNPKLILGDKYLDPSNVDSYPSHLIEEFSSTLIDPDKNIFEFKGKLSVEKRDKVILGVVDNDVAIDISDIGLVPYLHFIYQVYHTVLSNSSREIHLIINKRDLNVDMQRTLFFVYIKAGGVPAIDTPCRLDETWTVGVTFDYGILYNQMMQYTTELANKCELPKGFIDMILKFEAFKTSVESEHLVRAVDFFKYIIDNSVSSTTKTCGCYGGNSL